MVEASESSNVYELVKNSELRFEVADNEKLSLELLSGEAEIFGSEMAPKLPYTFEAGTKAAAFTFTSCTLKVTGKADSAYVSKITQMVTFANIHSALEQLREQAVGQEMGRGPRVLVAGPTDVGKSTLCRILLNYAARANRTPVYVDTDVGQNDISISGTVGALLIDKPADIVDGFPKDTALVYHFGHKSLSENLDLFDHVVKNVADAVNMRGENSDAANVSGVIINSCGWVRQAGYKALVNIAMTFEVDVIVVIDDERLSSELKRDMPEFAKIVNLQKPGGVTTRSQQFRGAQRDKKIREYFYGIKKNLLPHSFPIPFAEVRVFKIGAPDMPAALMPIGADTGGHQLKVIGVEPSQALKHKVLSVSMADAEDSEDDLLSKNVAGFVVIADVDLEKKKFVVLAPSPAPLPRPFLVVMDLTFMDIH